jgi:hypothetical protein
MKKPRLFKCSCGSKGTYEYIVEHAREKGHKLDPCSLGQHEYDVLKTYFSTSGKVTKLRCRNCGFKKKVTQV